MDRENKDKGLIEKRNGRWLLMDLNPIISCL